MGWINCSENTFFLLCACVLNSTCQPQHKLDVFYVYMQSFWTSKYLYIHIISHQIRLDRHLWTPCVCLCAFLYWTLHTDFVQALVRSQLTWHACAMTTRSLIHGRDGWADKGLPFRGLHTINERSHNLWAWQAPVTSTC